MNRANVTASALALMSVQMMARRWWEMQPHPYAAEFPADDFAASLLGYMHLRLIAVQGSHESEEMFAALIGWRT